MGVGTHCIVEPENNSIVTITELEGGVEKKTHFEQKFNYLTLLSDLEIDANCRSIANFIDIDVDNQRFVLEGKQFKCMLNNELRFSGSTIDVLSEQRWAVISRFMIEKKQSRARFDKAVRYIMDTIIQEETKKANPETFAALSRKYADTRYRSFFLKSGE